MKTKFRWAVAGIVFFLLGLDFQSNAQLRLPSLFSDGMVLQQKAETAVWGWAEPGSSVKVNASWGVEVDAHADKDGRWTAALPTGEAGGPYVLTVSSTSAVRTDNGNPQKRTAKKSSGKAADVQSIEINDVLVGEVWICAGQSNMAMPVRGYTSQPVENSLQTVLEAPKYQDRIRVFTVPRDSSSVEREDCEAKWRHTSTDVTATTSVIAYLFAKRLTEALDVPVGIIVSAYGGTKIEPWTPAEFLAPGLSGVISDKAIEKKYAVRNTGKRKPEQVGTIYNAMIRPLAPYTAKGFLWYQGCSSRRDYNHYGAMQAAMVKGWRQAWGDSENEMPFQFVTIAPYSYNDSMDNSRAKLVENQLLSLNIIKNSYAVVSEDAGEEFSIHPPHKARIADRLAWNVLAKEYGFKGLTSGYPYCAKYEINGDEVVLYMENARYGLCPSYGKPIKGFMVAGEDRRFHPAEAVIKDKPARVIVRSDKVASPAAVRYSFFNYCESNLCDVFGVPVPPFRTDDWEN
ncbi:MAG: sialate O-acetylesterase [Candidatus Cryptobacteroides sp.]